MKFRLIALMLVVGLSACAIESGEPESQDPAEPVASSTEGLCKEVCRNVCPPKQICTMQCELKCKGEVCGNKVCGPKEVCCNPLMSICTAPDQFCIM